MPGFFFLPKSDRRILMVLIGIIVVALGVLFIDKPQEKPTALQPAADTVDTRTITVRCSLNLFNMMPQSAKGIPAVFTIKFIPIII